MPENDLLVLKWNQMAKAWNEGIGKGEGRNNSPRINKFVKFANYAGAYLREAAKLCKEDKDEDTRQGYPMP